MARSYECSNCLHVQIVGVIDNGLSGFADPHAACESCGETGKFLHAPGWQERNLPSNIVEDGIAYTRFGLEQSGRGTKEIPEPPRKWPRALFKNKAHHDIYEAFCKSGEVAGEGFVLRIAEIAADAVDPMWNQYAVYDYGNDILLSARFPALDEAEVFVGELYRRKEEIRLENEIFEKDPRAYMDEHGTNEVHIDWIRGPIGIKAPWRDAEFVAVRRGVTKWENVRTGELIDR